MSVLAHPSKTKWSAEKKRDFIAGVLFGLPWILGVLIFQDLCVIPMILALPILSGARSSGTDAAGGTRRGNDRCVRRHDARRHSPSPSRYDRPGQRHGGADGG